MKKFNAPLFQPRFFRFYALVLAAAWTIVVGASLGWSVYKVNQDVMEYARMEAKGAYNKDLVYRRWAALHGGVYVPVTEKTPPNPYLSHVEQRDIPGPKGKLLTLINPAYMTRQVHELGEKQYGLRGHITSLNPIRPENAAYPWEEEFLEKFETGETELSTVASIDGEPYLHWMRVLITEQSCLKCHAQQGYAVGDIRGGISVSLKLEPFLANAVVVKRSLFLGHGAIWILGLLGIAIGTGRINDRERKRFNAEKMLERERGKLEILLEHKTLVANIASRLNCAYSFENEISEALETMNETFSMDRVFLYMFDSDRGNLLKFTTVSTNGVLPANVAQDKICCSIIPDLTEKVKSCQGEFTFDFHRLPEAARDFFVCSNTCNHLVWSVRNQDKTLGFICFSRREKIEWTAEKSELINTITDIIANGWERDLQRQARVEAERARIVAIQEATHYSRLASIGELAAEVNHEITQPLNTISLIADLVLQNVKHGIDIAPKKIVSHFESVSNQVQRIDKIITHMREFWIKPTASSKEIFDLNLTVMNSLSLVDRRLHSHGIMLKTKLGADSLMIEGNPTGMEQIVLNLVKNAMNALEKIEKKDKEIAISTRRVDHGAVLEVNDNATGIDEDEIDKLFEPFYTTGAPGEGTGLGLSIVKRIVDSFNGLVRAQNNDSGGAVFTVELPLCRPEQVDGS